jgi:glycosyltransferase involved in cell wall biosynthesis
MKTLRLCFVGNMLGRHRGYNTTQGEINAKLFSAAGYNVVLTSSKKSKAARIFDIVRTLLLRAKRIDLAVIDVYSGQSFFIADAASFICRRSRIPIVMVMHGGALPQFIDRHKRWSRRVLARADRLVAPSEFLARELRDRGFEIRVISNVLDLEKYEFKLRRSAEPNLLWMRSFHSIYNPEMAVKVIAELRKEFPSATLTMAGADKGLKTRTERLAQKMELSEAIRFPGFLGDFEKAEQFRICDIFINTNRFDNMPVAVLEAQASGLPVIATAVGGLPDVIVDGEDGILVGSDDVPGMTEAISRLINDPQLTQKLSMHGRSRAERSAWAKVRKAWEATFAELLKENGSMDRQFTPRRLSAEFPTTLR